MTTVTSSYKIPNTGARLRNALQNRLAYSTRWAEMILNYRKCKIENKRTQSKNSTRKLNK